MGIVRASIVAFLTVAVTAPAAAQRCMAANAWGRDAFRLGVAALRSSAGEGFGGRLAIGQVSRNDRTAFAEVTATRVVPADDPAREAVGGAVNPAYGVDAELGYELPVAGGVARVCPVLGFGYTSGPEVLIPDRSGAPGSPAGELEIEHAGPRALIGAWVGAPVARAGHPSVVVAGGLHLIHDRATQSSEGVRDGFPVDEETQYRDNWLRLSLAVGINVARHVVLRPLVALPVTSAGPRETMWELGLTFNFAG